MADTILLNNEDYHISEDGLPCLIHYAPMAGGSHFSVAMVADLFLHGSKILFLTAYPMTKDNFLQQIKGSESKTAFVTEESQLNTNAQAIILESGNEQLFLQAVKKLDDLNERVVLVKNMEVFSDAVFDSCLKLQKIILSGDVDKCSAKKQISDKQYKTIVLFSKSETPLKVEPPELEKYKGYLWSDGKEGLVSVKMEN
ncbi:MAG: hypothetical protein COV07_03085 [Candidatus Vogelbacteria bacterium CG10_big_fil_rev_8_21_14_0_10_45_14]|uniref:KaiC-like domain-containing protein n=1 Tax=Candidatus Vogelbacteria bacterium CG10_big_fil_rev_8_21_14_0_10_45_14 TaxID=1975042 RepID=A0A2H0RJI5_9BACT|nr:MAG: hypothetical protein COV07_03085 [Candidatus Vogelbacteria bacterium CG10_big_fil_rev_8_21_14_0_10_45_14]